MASLFRCHNINRIVLHFVLSAFVLTYAVPVNAVQFGVVSDAVFIYKAEKLVEKIWRLKNSESKSKMYEIILDLKSEIESYSGIEIDISKYMSLVENELESRGIKSKKKELKAIRNSLKKREKKRNKYINFLGLAIETEGYEIHPENEKIVFSNFLMAKGKENKKSEEEDEEEVYVPAQLVFGVTLTLCGLFLMVIPIPVCKPWGERMIASGVVICGNSISSKVDNDHKNNKGKKTS